jgi:hypothetical protein
VHASTLLFCLQFCSSTTWDCHVEWLLQTFLHWNHDDI